MNSKSLIGSLVTLVLIAVLTGCVQPASLPTAVPAASSEPFPGLKEWNLLIISDSSNWKVGKPYARLIEADRKVKVNLHDCWMGGMAITEPLELLQLNAEASCGGKWTKLVQDAQVIVLFGNPTKSQPPDVAWDSPNMSFTCVYGNYPDKDADPAAFSAYLTAVTKSCAPETFAIYKADWSALFDKIMQVRAGRPVILRATDFYIPVHSKWEKAGIEDVCRACFDNMVAAIHQVAAEHGVPVASSMDALNGPDHRSDPVEKGYIAADGEHLTDSGAEVVAEALRKTGYTYAGK